MTMDELARKLNQTADRLQDPARLRPLYPILESQALAAVRESFFRQADPETGNPWPPRKKAYPWPPLRKSGRLFGTLGAAADESGIVVADGTFYAIHQQRGTKKVPARPFLGLSAGALSRMAGAIVEYEASEALRAFRGQSA